MKQLILFIGIISVGICFHSCDKTPRLEEMCPEVFNNCYAGAWAMPHTDCQCACRGSGNHSISDAGNAFCVISGSYVAYIEEKPDHLDTFGIYMPFTGTSTTDGILVKSIHDTNNNMIGRQVGLLAGTEFFIVPSERPEGDSIIIDGFEPLDRSFWRLSPIPNRFSEDRPYRLRFEAWIPQGINKGKMLQATVHYLYGWSDIPAREPVSFEMYMVE
jgi:hypothetical protein